MTFRQRGRWLAVFLAFLSCLAFERATARAAELVLFESPGCPWCARWRAEVGPGYPKSDEGMRAPLRAHALADADNAGVQLAAPVVASPTFVLVENGREIGRSVGYPGADFFWGLFAQLIAKLDRASIQERHGARLSLNKS